MKKQFEEFSRAAQALSVAWSEAQKHIDDALYQVEYPFDRSFDELSYDIHRWCEDAIEAIEYHAPKKYVVYTGGIKDTRLERGWWYKASVAGEEYDVVIFEDIGRPTANEVCKVSYEQFKNHFFEVPEQLYNLYEVVCSNGEHVDEVVELTHKLYNKKEEK
jgi:hypothetical protein